MPKTENKPKCCYRCNSLEHLASATNCPAKNATCRSSNKTGHFQKVCRSKDSNLIETQTDETVLLHINTKGGKSLNFLQLPVKL